MKCLKKRPWLWIVLAFISLIGAWSALITIALKNQPEKIPVPGKEMPDRWPWQWITLGFVGLMVVIAVIIMIAAKSRPEEDPTDTAPGQS